MIRVDPETATRVRYVLERCRVNGTDPVRALDELGLLDYPSKRQAADRNVIRMVADSIEMSTPTQLGGGKVPTTAMDMKRCIVDTINGFASAGGDRHGQ